MLATNETIGESKIILIKMKNNADVDDQLFERFFDALAGHAHNGTTPEGLNGAAMELNRMGNTFIKCKIRADIFVTWLKTLPGWSNKLIRVKKAE